MSTSSDPLDRDNGAVTEHLIALPERDDAERIAEDLRGEGFTEVRVVREELAGEDDAEAAEWVVYVREEMVADESGPVGQALKERFAALAEEHGGWYDEPRSAGPSAAAR